MSNKIKKDHYVLVLSEIHTGGEWIATNRLIKAMSLLPGAPKFISVCFTEEYKKQDLSDFIHVTCLRFAKAHSVVTFFGSLVKNFVNTRQSIIQDVESVGSIDYVLCTHFLMMLAVMSVPQLWKIPKVYYFHGIKSSVIVSFRQIRYHEVITKTLERLALILSTVIITPSNWSKRYVKKMLGPASLLTKIYVVSNGTPKEYLTPVVLNAKTIKKIRKLGISSHNRIILYSGRVNRIKGVDLTIDACKKLVSRYNNILLIVAYPTHSSDGSYLDELQRKTIDYGLSENVRFLPDLEIDQLRILYQISDLSILPSLIEMGPLTFLESLASSTPCIATAVGDMDVILSRIDPLLILRNNTSQEIQRAVNYYFSLPKERIRELKKMCREIVQSYTTNDQAIRFSQVLEIT